MDESVAMYTERRRLFLESLSETAFTDSLALASLLCSAPIVVLSFHDTDRTWHQAPPNLHELIGNEKISLAAIIDFCRQHSRNLPPTTAKEVAQRQAISAAKQSIQFYLGCALASDDGQIIGMLHILGPEKKVLSADQIQGLGLVAKIIADPVQQAIANAMERKKEEEVLEKQTEFLDAVLENLADGVIACNELGQLTVFNRVTREFHGLDSRGDMDPSQWSEYYNLFYGDGKTPMQLEDIPLRRAFQGEVLKGADLVIDSRQGGRRDILCHGRAMYNKAGKKLGAVVAMQDITLVKRANARSETTTKMLQALVDTCPVGIAVFDLDEKILMWNPGNEKIFGWKKEEVLNKFMPYTDETHRRQARDTIQLVRESKKPIEGSRKRFRKDGRPVDVHLSLLPLLGDDDEIYGFMCVFIDISDVKQREQNLLESNQALQAASVAKSEFLANMSHEILTPLNGMIGMTDLVLTSNLTIEQREQLQLAKSSANSLLAIISDILDFSMVESGKLEFNKFEFNIERVIDEVFESLQFAADAKKLTLRKEIPAASPTKFLGDSRRVRQILMNLVSNSVKFSEHGEIVTRLSLFPIDSFHTRVQLEVADNGIGIPKSILSRLFEPFSQADSSATRKFGGTGLGLSICKKLIELMGGNIHVSSEVGSGSIFRFTLDLANSLTSTIILPKLNTVASSKTQPAAAPCRILLVEDNTVNQRVALSMLALLGYQADVVSNGQLALEALRITAYDLVIMDCQMPQMDGYEATRQIRASEGLPNKIPIVAVTANAMKGDREKCLQAGMTDYLPKPLRIGSLADTLLRNLRLPVTDSEVA